MLAVSAMLWPSHAAFTFKLKLSRFREAASHAEDQLAAYADVWLGDRRFWPASKSPELALAWSAAAVEG